MHSHSNTVLILSSVSWSITYNHVVAIDYQNRRYIFSHSIIILLCTIIFFSYNNIILFHITSYYNCIIIYL